MKNETRNVDAMTNTDKVMAIVNELGARNFVLYVDPMYLKSTTTVKDGYRLKPGPAPAGSLRLRDLQFEVKAIEAAAKFIDSDELVEAPVQRMSFANLKTLEPREPIPMVIMTEQPVEAEEPSPLVESTSEPVLPRARANRRRRVDTTAAPVPLAYELVEESGEHTDGDSNADPEDTLDS